MTSRPASARYVLDPEIELLVTLGAHEFIAVPIRPARTATSLSSVRTIWRQRPKPRLALLETSQPGYFGEPVRGEAEVRIWPGGFFVSIEDPRRTLPLLGRLKGRRIVGDSVVLARAEQALWRYLEHRTYRVLAGLSG